MHRANRVEKIIELLGGGKDFAEVHPLNAFAK
jgi:hypothetical protein